MLSSKALPRNKMKDMMVIVSSRLRKWSQENSEEGAATSLSICSQRWPGRKVQDFSRLMNAENKGLVLSRRAVEVRDRRSGVSCTEAGLLGTEKGWLWVTGGELE